MSVQTSNDFAHLTPKPKKNICKTHKNVQICIADAAIMLPGLTIISDGLNLRVSQSLWKCLSPSLGASG